MIKVVKKGIVLPFIIILASVSLILGAFFLFDNKPKTIVKQKLTQQASPSPTPQSLDDDINYTIPTGWVKDSNTISAITLTSPDYEAQVVSDPKDGMMITISKYPEDKFPNTCPYEVDIAVSNPKSMTIDGIPAIQQFIDQGDQIRYCLKRNGYTWDIRFYIGDSEKDNYQNLLNGFLLSFSFVDQTQQVDTSNWKTYNNNVEKFSVQYPQDWTYKEESANVKFFPPGETNNDKSISLSVSDAPPPPCYSETTTLRTVKRGNKEVLVQKGSCYLRGKYTTDEFYQNKYVRLIFGESLDNKYDPIFDQILSTFKFLDQPDEGKFCGGIAGIVCPTDYKCSLDGNYPDAGGKCVKE